MSYQVLARKWRPRYFAEMIGQDHVVRALTNALDQDRLHHAYLFSGTRGVGKTTVARIFAKSLNCEKGVSSTPCGECTACVEIDEGRFIDLIEVDAASRTGVDDTRELMDNVSYAPTRGRYKVYLIDEVHMFSKSSFNALLKTLEEPPPHVKFLLATTDPQKLLPTVLSRCLQFNLKRVSVEQIAGHVSTILESESINSEPAAVQRIARAADGSVRDSLSLLDQAIAFSQGAVTLEHVDAMLGGVSQQRVYDLLEAVHDGDAQQIFSQLESLDDYAPDYAALLADLLALLHQIAVCQAVPDSRRESVVDPERLQRLAQLMSAEDAQLYYQIALTGRRDMPYAPDERDALEMTLLRMLAFHPVSSGERGSGTDKATPAPLKKAPVVATASSSPGPAAVAETPVPEDIPEPVDIPRDEVPAAEQLTQPVAASEGSTELTPGNVATQHDLSNNNSGGAFLDHSKWQTAQWREISSQLGLQGMYAQLVAHCSLHSVSDTSVNLVLDETHQHLNNPKMVKRVEEAIRQLSGREVRLKLEVGAPTSETPAQRQQRERDERLQNAQASITNDPVVQDIQRRFDASIAVDAIEPLNGDNA